MTTNQGSAANHSNERILSVLPSPSKGSHEAEVEAAKRFAFGKNWRNFINTVDDRRIKAATDSLARLLGPDKVRGRSFLDIGSGSGLSSLAALRLGASRVHSFDYDDESVASTTEMRLRTAPDAANWTIEQGDALSETYLASLGTFDIVYSWGVLHHTGQMWKALDSVTALVAPGGTLSVALYNDQGRASRVWVRLKRLYNLLPAPLRPVMVVTYAIYGELRSIVGRRRRGLVANPFRHWAMYREQRGMSVWHDYVDWMGGYPFEVATPAQVRAFYEARGFSLAREFTVGRDLGCNEFVFTRR